MKIKKYLAHCYELETGEKTNVHWTPKQFELAEHLVRMGAIGLIENRGYFYKFEELRKALKRLGKSGQLSYFYEPPK